MITRLVSCVIIGDASRSRATPRSQTDTAFLLVSENIISTHVGRQHIHLAKQLIGYGPIDKKNSQNKLFLIATAREYFFEIHHLVGIVAVHAEPLAAVKI